MSDFDHVRGVILKNYSPCDISDALLTLGIPGAGHLADIHPIPSRANGKNRLVAPISTILFVPNDFDGNQAMPPWVPKDSQLPADHHWTDVAPPGSVSVMQVAEPDDHPPIIAGLLGDIVANRYKTRGVLGAVVDGRSRDVVGCGKLCEDGDFQCWTKGLTSTGTSMQAKPWAVNIPIKIGLVDVEPGDILCADEAEQIIAVIPHSRLKEVVDLLPSLKKADDGVLLDAQSGVDLKTSFKKHPEHYTQRH